MVAQSFRIGVIADTHGVFDRAILRHFAGVDHILHAGAITPAYPARAETRALPGP